MDGTREKATSQKFGMLSSFPVSWTCWRFVCTSSTQLLISFLLSKVIVRRRILVILGALYSLSAETFTGHPKPLAFADNRDRFAAFSHKLFYRHFPGQELSEGKSAWDIEAQTRDTMTALLRDTFTTHNLDVPPLVIFADADEIPSRHSVELIRKCSAPNPIHLQMRNFLYSFEWFLGVDSQYQPLTRRALLTISTQGWRASINRWEHPPVYYRHSQETDVILADAGWHCSYCFRYLDEFVQKMKGTARSAS
jgi:beta-1,4-mannosyl-glycoprotein beta-1,4-N-acetylglucosaminyltransferase